ncbi:MAG: peptidyl-prolyl cis-trans isomerase, partial [Desulfovibrionales bacterium]|nr:peptidyl-prolyl cis-trans isomerase [Desulfovibrionales bacterium]
VVDAIAQVPTGSFGFHQNVPTEPVAITRVYVEE